MAPVVLAELLAISRRTTRYLSRVAGERLPPQYGETLRALSA
jgi:hypothetical protein